METESLQKYHDLFVMNITLILNTIITEINDNSSVKKNAIIFYQALDNRQFDMTKTSEMIKKVFSVISKNLDLFKNKDSRIFELKEMREDREVKVTIIPGIDLYEAYVRFNDTSRNLLWKYLKSLYYSSIKMIYTVNGSMDPEILKIERAIKKVISETEIQNDFYEKNPYSKLYRKEDTFNPYIGVGDDTNGNFGVDELSSGPELLGDQTAPGIGSMASLLGIDKMFNLSQLTDQLKNIDPKEIEAHSESIKKMLGDNVDEGTSEMINMMLHDITDELKKDKLSQSQNPVDSIIKIAETVAGKIAPRLDPKKMDMNKIWQSTQNLAKNYTDQKGEKVFNNENNPLTMLTGLMEKQMKSAKAGVHGKQAQGEIIKEYQDVMNKMGMGNINLSGLQNMMNNNSPSNSSGSSQKKKKSKK
ncbi:hypothetical protein Catovirus_2_317 [Catovirus CTV1]|uniref:Uncharacterized protein n=1 Tax=Catovirus CTV1 TaxID=1977631 RepID=A0A1V0SCI0_9VIRU|nr:hypothetical protein Catovirus_2_317 [Catovirus CTV1]